MPLFVVSVAVSYGEFFGALNGQVAAIDACDYIFEVAERQVKMLSAWRVSNVRILSDESFKEANSSWKMRVTNRPMSSNCLAILGRSLFEGKRITWWMFSSRESITVSVWRRNVSSAQPNWWARLKTGQGVYGLKAAVHCGKKETVQVQVEVCEGSLMYLWVVFLEPRYAHVMAIFFSMLIPLGLLFWRRRGAPM